MENYKVTRREANMIIYGLVCAGVEELMAGSPESHDEFLELAHKFKEWTEEAEHASNT